MDSHGFRENRSQANSLEGIHKSSIFDQNSSPIFESLPGAFHRPHFDLLPSSCKVRSTAKPGSEIMGVPASETNATHLTETILKTHKGIEGIETQTTNGNHKQQRKLNMPNQKTKTTFYNKGRQRRGKLDSKEKL